MPVNALEESLLYFKCLGFEIQLKPEQRKSIINLLRGEDAGYRVLPIVILPTCRIFTVYVVEISLDSHKLTQEIF
jgi:hypothetical protein